MRRLATTSARSWPTLNFDMLGSPIYVRFVYDGDGSDTPTAGPPYDHCHHHQACDTTDNLSTKALNELGDGAAHAVMTLARSRTGFFEDGSFCTPARTAAAATRLSSTSQAAA